MAVPQIAGCLHRYYHLSEIFDAPGRPLFLLATPAEVLGRSIVNGLDQQTIPFGQIGPKSLFSALTNPSWGTLFNLLMAQGAADNQRRSREPSARPSVTVVVTRASSVPIRATTQPPSSSTPIRHQ
jgi:hypothetical protein